MPERLALVTLMRTTERYESVRSVMSYTEPIALLLAQLIRAKCNILLIPMRFDPWIARAVLTDLLPSHMKYTRCRLLITYCFKTVADLCDSN